MQKTESAGITDAELRAIQDQVVAEIAQRGCPTDNEFQQEIEHLNAGVAKKRIKLGIATWNVDRSGIRKKYLLAQIKKLGSVGADFASSPFLCADRLTNRAQHVTPPPPHFCTDLIFDPAAARSGLDAALVHEPACLSDLTPVEEALPCIAGISSKRSVRCAGRSRSCAKF